MCKNIPNSIATSLENLDQISNNSKDPNPNQIQEEYITETEALQKENGIKTGYMQTTF